MVLLWTFLTLVVALVLPQSRARSDNGRGGAQVVVGSKNFTESRILAEIVAQLIEARTDLTVFRRANLGGTQLVFSALANGQIDLYPEYTGTAWAVLLDHERPATDPLKTYLQTGSELSRHHDLAWTAPFGFENSYALAMREDRAAALGIRTISDLRAHQDEIEAGLSHEFLNRGDGYPGLTSVYGIDLRGVRGMEHGLAYQALAQGRIDLVDTWTTDAKLQRYPLRLLEDDLDFFPPYDAAPLLRRDLLERHPEVAAVLDQLGFTIDQERMQRLNYAVEEEGRSVPDVAAEFLREARLLDPSEQAAAATPKARANRLLPSLWQNRAMLLDRGIEHIWLTALAVGLATLVAVPLGILLTRSRALQGPVLGVTGVIQTIPSLALLAFMIPIPGLGLGSRSAVAALFLYALLPVVRNTYTGIREVDPDLIDAARGMGLTDRQILTRVELPLAVRTIMGGIRTSTVISIGVATLAAFIGAGGLGDPILTGLQLNDTILIMTGAVPAAALALVVDFVLARLEARLTPPGVT